MSTPLTKSECNLLVNGELTNQQLAIRFNCNLSTVKRVKRRIRAGDPVVYLFQPPPPRRPPQRRHFRNADNAGPKELRENSLGSFDLVAACDRHLEDLRAEYGQRQTIFAPTRKL